MSIADIVNAWFGERIAAGAVARDTDAYNQVHAALPDLIGRLESGAVAAPAEPGGKSADKASDKAPAAPSK